MRDGMIVVHGERSHLYYTGPVQNANFKNFEFKADVMTTPGANSGIYLHTAYQEEDWPKKGYECQVNNSYGRDPQRTGGLYDVSKVLEPPAKDNQWFTQHIIVNGKRIIIKIDGKTVVDYTEPPNVERPEWPGRKLSSGTFALQGHDPDSLVYYKNIMVKPQDDLLEYLISRQEAARQAVDSFSGTIELHFDCVDSMGDKTNTSLRDIVMERTQQGDNLRLVAEERIQGVVEWGPEGLRKGPYARSFETFLVRNSDYVAQWERDGQRIRQELTISEHTSADTMDRNTKGGIELAQGYDIMDFAFGLMSDFLMEQGDLRSVAARLSDKGEFTVERSISEGQEVFLVKHSRQGDTLLTATIDPNRGFATTKLAFNYISSRQEQHCEYEVDVREFSPGVWAPIALDAAREWVSDGHSTKTSLNIQVTSLTFEESFPQDIFTWQSLGYPGGIGFRRDLAGQGHLLRIQGTERVPHEQSQDAAQCPWSMENGDGGK